MRPEDIRKLVGGYATGTLTADERRLLLEAALEDQALFNELAREQDLKDLLEDPRARQRLLEALAEKPSLLQMLGAWLRRPVAWAAAGGLAAAAILLLVVVRQPGSGPAAPEPVLTAKLEQPREEAPAPARAIPPVRSQDKAVEPRVPSDVAASRDGKGAAASERKDEAKTKPPAAAPPVSEPAAKPVLGGAVPADEAQGTPATLEKRQMAATSRGGAAQPSAASIRFQAAEADSLPSPIPYRLLRADETGNFRETPETTVFGREDRIRVVFTPAEDGRLTVEARPPQTLLDQNVTAGASVTLDIPRGLTRLTGAFRGVPLEIRIPRGPE